MSLIKLVRNAHGLDFKHDAPIIENVIVHHHSKRKNKSAPLLGLIDTGSDGSSIPRDLIRELELEATGKGSNVEIVDAQGNKAVMLRLFFRLRSKAHV